MISPMVYELYQDPLKLMAKLDGIECKLRPYDTRTCHTCAEYKHVAV